jgi:hypothetical protein
VNTAVGRPVIPSTAWISCSGRIVAGHDAFDKTLERPQVVRGDILENDRKTVEESWRRSPTAASGIGPKTALVANRVAGSPSSNAN